MTRMSREFSLVLLGAGLLTAGYFAWPEQDFEKKAEEQARKRVGGNGQAHAPAAGSSSSATTAAGPASAAGRSPAMASVSKGGFGSIGGRVGGGFGG